MTPFDAIRYVGTPLTLIAFIIAIGAYVYRVRAVERRRMIESAPDTERGALIDATIRDLTTIDTSTLTREQRYDLALRLIAGRAARFRMMMFGGLAAAVAITAIIIVAPGAEASTMSLVVRVQEAGGAFVTGGDITLDAGPARDTRAVGPDGQVRFESVPREAFASGVQLHSRVPGYAAVTSTLSEPPAGGIYYLELQRESTMLTGSVSDASGNPADDVVLLFADGTAVDTTDALGRFSISLPHAPGARIPLRMMREGVVGFDDFIVVPQGEALALRFTPEE